MTGLSFSPEVLDQIMPLHLVIDRDGRILRNGPTFERLARPAVGCLLPDVLRLLQPKLEGGVAEMLAHAGRRLTVQLRHELGISGREQRTRMRAVAYDIGQGQALMNLFFGADVAKGVLRHRLSARDFATFDPTVEMLFLMEAQAAVMDEFQSLRDRLVEARRAAEEQAITDKLTGLHNRRAMDRHLGELVEKGATFGLMHLDLDYFKSVNDTFGHAAGDHVLSIVGHVLRSEVRRGDMVARVGGDEFMLVFDDCADVELMRRIAERIITQLEEPIAWEGNLCRISASIGITMSSFYALVEADRLMSDADTALYASKHAGRSRYSIARPYQTGATAARGH